MLGASYPAYQSAHRASGPEQGVAVGVPAGEGAGCAPSGASVVTLPKKSDAEPTIFLPLAPDWAGLPDTAATDQAGASSSVRAYIANDAIHEDGFSPFIQVDLASTTSTDSGSAIAADVYAKAGSVMSISNRSVGTVCGATVYRSDMSGFNPDGKGPQSGSSIFTVVEAKDGTRWIAVASIKTRNPANPAYLAQREALLAGFHAGFP